MLLIYRVKSDKNDVIGVLERLFYKYLNIFIFILAFVTDLTECSADIVNHSYIPIIVGSSLGGLIIVVLIAYIIGRRCESKGGYDTI